MYVVGIRRRGIDVWDCDSKQRLATVTAEGLLGYGRSSDDGRMLAALAADLCTVVVWDIGDIHNCKVKYEIKQSAPIYTMCFTRGSDQLIMGQLDKVALYDAVDGSLFRAAEDDITSTTILVRPVGDEILAVSCDGILRMWDAALGSCRLKRLHISIQSVCVAPSEDLAALAISDGILILDLGLLEPRTTIQITVRVVTNLQFSTAGTRILARVLCGGSNTHVYDVNSAALLFQFYSNCIAFLSLDNTRIYGSSTDEKLTCWEAESGAEETCPFIALDITPPSRYISIFEMASPVVVLM
jgi:WD40 repeat protein